MCSWFGLVVRENKLDIPLVSLFCGGSSCNAKSDEFRLIILI